MDIDTNNDKWILTAKWTNSYLHINVKMYHSKQATVSVLLQGCQNILSNATYHLVGANAKCIQLHGFNTEPNLDFILPQSSSDSQASDDDGQIITKTAYLIGALTITLSSDSIINTNDAIILNQEYLNIHMMVMLGQC